MAETGAGRANQRRVQRAKRRLACALVLGERRHSGVILDLSPTGMFVQTNAKPERDETVRLELSLPGRPEPLRLEAVVVRAKRVPPHLVTVAHGGVGLRLTSAPEDYFEFMAQVMPRHGASVAASTATMPPSRAAGARKGAARSAAQSEPPGQVFRLRAARIGGSRTRTLRVSRPDEEQARAAALDQLGEEWKILDCTPE